MATYYVRKTGSDAAAGTSPGAAWLTIGKALGAAGIASGDTCYVGSGVYREVVTVAMTSATAETKLIADVTGVNTGDPPDEVQWTAFLTSDLVAPSASDLLNLAGRDYLTIEGFSLIGGGTAHTINATTLNSTNITIRNCYIANLLSNSNGKGIELWVGAGVTVTWLVENCIFNTGGWHVHHVYTRHSADYDAAIVHRNNIYLGGIGAFVIESTGAGAGYGGGTIVHNCTCLWSTRMCQTFTTALSTVIPNKFYNNIIFGRNDAASFQSSLLGAVIEDYNIVVAGVARVNTTAGGNSKTNITAPLIELGQALLRGANVRPFSTPAPASAGTLLGFGADATYGAALTTDLFGNPRPAGGASALKAVGALERGNTWAKETTTVRTGSNALSITGPGYQDFYIPVDASATTVTCYLRQDTTYAGTSPKLIALANAEIGVTEQTDTLAVADDTWEQLSVAFTPTAKGIITIRLLSSDTNGGGKAFADDFGVA